MATYFSYVEGDLPAQERARGGSRDWTADASDAVRAQFERTSAVNSDRPDDFEALKAAALRQLKDKKRRRSVVMPATDGSGGISVHDAKRLDKVTSQRIMDRVMEHPHEDEEASFHDDLAIMHRLRNRLAAVGLSPPTITVRYQDVTVTGKIIVGSRALPSLASSISSRLQPALSKLGSSRVIAPQRHTVLDSASGILKPGKFTLLLGPPQSGKTTFLRTLAGLTRHTPGLKVNYHELTYNGFSFDEFVPERSVAYISQVDLHYGELTVRETLDFSARVQGSGHRRSIAEELEERERAAGISVDPALDIFFKSMVSGGKHTLITELVLRLLGLEHVSGTVVGSAMLRGISGGQKKRLTSGEIMVGPSRALFADEISTGLDSNTTYEIVKALRDLCHVMQATVLVGLLQPAPETYDLFDDVILLSAGRVVFHGPLDAVLPFFEGLGFSVPANRGIADFLQEVTVVTEQERYWADETRAWRYITPRSIQKAYHDTEMWKAMEEELSTLVPKEVTATRSALAKAKYGASAGKLLRAVVSRAWILQRRTKLFAIIRTFQVGLMALVLSSLFWREDKNNVDDGNYFLGVLFYSLLYQLLGGTSEMHVLCDRLPVFHKQRAMRFYPGWTFAISAFALRIPYSFLESTIWTHIVYWLVGFNPSVRFLMFWAILFLANAWSVLLFQLIAAICRDDTIATAVGSFFLLIFINMSGFVINAGSVPGWWQEGLWTNPFYYSMKALAINEFTSSSWDKPNPANPSHQLGSDVLKFRGFPEQYWWCWVAIGYMIVTGILNFMLFMAALSFLGPFKRRVAMSSEALEEYKLAGRATSSLPRVHAMASAPPPQQSPEKNKLGSPPASSETPAVSAILVTAGSAAENDYVSPLPAHEIPPSGGRAAGSALTPGRPLTAGSLAHVGVRRTSFVGGYPSPQAGSPLGSFTSVVSSPRRVSLPFSERLSFTQHAAALYREHTAIPFIPVVLTFRDVEYSVPLPKDADAQEVPSTGPHAGQLRLLRNINGVFRPQILTALMGASGAGKTTLLDCLADRKTGGKITGDIKVNGHPKESSTFARVGAYVEQTDVHLPQTSVKEALEFSARLRLPTTVDADTRSRFVDEVLALVELDRISGAFVGVPGVSGLNVEQRKRLTLAVELASNPSILFLDEPTSGLDARAASIVMEAIRNTVNSGRTVVCTIHQPSYSIFEQFDELLLLKPGGRVVYNGPLGDGCDRLVEYLQGFPRVKPLPPRVNPANWMLEVTSAAGEETAKIDFAEAYGQSELARSMDTVIKEHEAPKPGSHSLEMGELHVASTWTQFTTNFHRFWRQYWRAPEYNITRLAVTLAVAFVFGSLFWRQGNKSGTVVGVLNIAGVLFASVLFVGITDCLTVQHVTSLQRAVMYRERAAGYYRILPFAIAQQLVEVPYLLVQTVIFSAIVYWMVYFAIDAGKFFLFMLFFFLSLLYFVIFGQMAVALTPAVALANVFSSFFFGFWNLFCGFLIPQPSMPVWYKYWLYWMNPVSWSLYSLSVSQLGDMSSNYIINLSGQIQTIPAFLAERFNWHRYMMWPCVAILLGFAAVFSFISITALKKINYQRR